ncbi:MAG: hypothetical protein ACP5JG_09705, partial [Anaerolineae bacterium]
TALLYDAEDRLVGGGTTWMEIVPAGDTVPVSIGVTGPTPAMSEAGTGIVDRVEIHTQIRIITEYE